MNAPTHESLPEEVMAFLDGELTPEKSALISAHLEACSNCRELTVRLKTTSQSLLQWQTDELKPSIQERIMENAANRESGTSARLEWLRNFQLFFSRPLPWALACLAMVILIGAKLTVFNFAAREISMDKARPYRSVLLANPPASSQVDYASANKAGGGGGGTAGKLEGREMFPTQRELPAAGPQARTGRELGASPSEPMIARTVSLSIVVKDFDAERASLDAILARHNGYAANLSVSTPPGASRVIQASLRIPAPQLAAAMGELKALGRVENETQNGEEVTQQHADLVARIKNDRETELRLQDILRMRTGKVKDVLDVEQEIARVRGEIEQMEAEQKTLERRVDFATIDLKLAEEYKAQLNTPAPSVLMQLRNATINGFRNAFESLLALVLFLAESGPSLLLWLALLGVPAWRLWRRYRRAQSLGSLAGA
jgi:anti-sigma factor RsiW